MNLRMICGVGALAAAACSHVNEPTVATAQIEGDHHVIIRAEAGRIWWAHRGWTEPHELWALPGQGEIQNLTVTRQQNAFVVTFEQGGNVFRGSFGEERPGATDNASELARSDR